MKEFIRDFHKRVAEIDKYFELVDRIEQLGAFSTNSITFPSGNYKVDSNLQKILKSNCYLLLYNLIESSIRNGINAIHDAISFDKLTYQDLSPKIKMLWLSNDCSKSFVDSKIRKETIAKNLQDVINAVIDGEIVELEPITNIPIFGKPNGNPNAKAIKKLIDMYGIPVNPEIPHDTLNFIVKIRCDLAHGNLSFSDASNEIIWNKSVSTTDSKQKIYRYLLDDKENVVKYLTRMLQDIDSYIDSKGYKL
ncbi:MAE_28990/MAE_18760 family HEPN-like nuclease [Pseudanabaena sp. UWO310]|uniref:MAE_28990/MAE_18760 family HEPN-like nuclease n=1 Tax=Pseudanabaena sp. UWO310 TaxID=2480795 RepID=UPI00115B7879|nr:MAE_28990/MAE_18760 family HEPN-like nuclease [Pseudanabaena sp. UWO310]TYQ28205.1 hypothetical protein PseudUWO310_14375 [Pseudanabaena sp. UWO310]